MKKIVKIAGIFCLSALFLVSGKNVMANDGGEYYEDYFTDDQGIVYDYYDEGRYYVSGFKQIYDSDNKPLVTKIKIPNTIHFSKVVGFTKDFVLDSNITEITFGNNIKKVEGVFQNCRNLKKVNLGEVTDIGKNTFKNCDNLEKLTALKLETIGESAFEGCTKLSAVCLNKKTDDLQTSKNVWKDSGIYKKFQKKKKPIVIDKILLDASTATGNLTVQRKNVRYIATNALAYAPKIKSITLQGYSFISDDWLQGSKATSIRLVKPKELADSLFIAMPKIKKITITGNAKISWTTMYGMKHPKKVTLYVDAKRVKKLKKKLSCNIKSVKTGNVIKGSMQNVSEENAVIVDSQGIVYELWFDEYYVTGIKQSYDAYGNPLHTSLQIPDAIDNHKVVAINKKDIFANRTDIVSVSLPGNIVFPDELFSGCTNLKEVVFRKSSAYNNICIKKNMFRGCRVLEKVVFADGIQYIGAYAFLNCSALKTIDISENIASIGIGAFQNSGLTSINLGKKISLIDNYVFEGCKNLTTVTLPETVELIYSHAFYQCSALKKVSFNNTPKSCYVENDAFDGTKWMKECQKKNQPLITSGILLSGSSVKGTLRISGKTVKIIAGYAFADNKKIKKVQIDGVKYISKCAFTNTSLESVTMKKVKNLDVEIFTHCKKLKTLEIYGTKKIGARSCVSIPGLKKVVLGKELKTMGLKAFANCKNLTSVTFQTTQKIKWEEKAPEIYQNPNRPLTFYGCTNLRHIYMKSKSVSSIMIDVFSKKVTIHVPKKYMAVYKNNSYCKVVAAR